MWLGWPAQHPEGVGPCTDALMNWLTLNNNDADTAARQAQALRGERFWELWSDVRRDLAFQLLVGRTVFDVHAAVGRAASRRADCLHTVEPHFWQPTSEHRLVLGGVAARGALEFVRRYGHAFLETFDPWCRRLREADVGANRPLRWISLFQLVVAYLLEVRRRPPFYDGASKMWYEPDSRVRGQLIQASAAQVAHWFGTTLRAYVRLTGGCYFSKDGRPDSAALQVKMRVVAIPWELAWLPGWRLSSPMSCLVACVAAGPGHGPTLGFSLVEHQPPSA